MHTGDIKWLDALERRFGRFAIPRLTLLLIAGQAAAYILNAGRPGFADALALVPARVAQGEFWRAVTFVFAPPSGNAFIAFFAWYFFFLMGSALERQWGAFRYTVFVLIACAATIAAAWFSPGEPATNLFIGGSVFLAFAYLFPEFEIYLFFVLPVKVKWLALLTWLGYGGQFVFGPWQTRLLAAASVANFLLFFGRDLLARARAGRRRMRMDALAATRSPDALHTCSVCGITERDDRAMEFRYCSACKPVRCYCARHLPGHAHATDG